MNFQAVDQANGNNIKIWATLSTWDGIAFTPNQAKYLSCKLVDDNGVGHKCRIYEGKGSLPEQEHLEKRMQFLLSCYQGKTEQGQPYTGYSGFWSHGATKGSQNSQQGIQPPAQATKAPQTGDTDIEIRKSVVCAYIAAGAAGAQMLVEEIEYWMEYIKTGVDATLPDNRPTENQPEDQRQAKDDDIPW